MADRELQLSGRIRQTQSRRSLGLATALRLELHRI